MPEDRTTISSSRLTAADVARHSFGTVRRGFDPAEVRTFLEAVGRELSNWEQRELELRREVAAAEERARNPVLDEATLTSSLGAQSAQVLRTAHEAADSIVREAEERASTLRHEAQQQIVAAEVSAGQRVAEAELAIGTLRQQLDAESAARQAADAEAREETLSRTREEGRAIVEEAQAARKRVLADLAQRRRTLHSQIEQFRAARDELAAAVLSVRSSVDRIVGDLSKADDHARAAAAEVRQRLESEPVVPDGAETVASAPSAASSSSAAPAASRSAGGGSRPAGALRSIGVAAGPAEEAVPPDPHDVEALFARLRASAPESDGGTETPPSPPVPAPGADSAREVRGGAKAKTDRTAAPAPTGTAGGEGEPQPGAGQAQAGQPGAGTVDAGAMGDAGAGQAQAGQSGAGRPGAGEGGIGAGEGGGGGDAARIGRRQELLDPVSQQMAKRLKRALQDDQNQMLERIRSAGGTWSDGMLPTDEDHRRYYAATAAPGLTGAWEAGGRFARAELEVADGDTPKAGSTVEEVSDPASVERLAGELASAVVAQLRRRLAGGGTGGEGAADAADRVSAAYREWRGERIEELVDDAAVAAFSGGTRAAGSAAAGSGSGRGVGLRWVVASASGGCADCDDNALAGVIGQSDEFPTGHRSPPAHGGCRCLIVPTTS